MALQTLTIRRPDDWHVHLRDGDMLRRSRRSPRGSSRGRSSCPTWSPPVTTIGGGAAYRERIWEAAGPRLPAADDLLPDRRSRSREVVATASTTTSGSRPSSIRRMRRPTARSGVTDVRNIYPALERMQRIGMVLCVHGEVTDPDVDVFDREAVFIERVLIALMPRLSRAEDRARAYHDRRGGGLRRRREPNVAATITPQHLHHQPQRHVRRRSEAARLLPAGGEAGEAPAGGAQGGDFGIAEILPRHRQRAACARTPRNPPAAAPASSTRLTRWKAMPPCSKRKARSTGWKASRRSTARVSTACRSTRAPSRWSASECEVPDRWGSEISSWCRSMPAQTLGWSFVAKPRSPAPLLPITAAKCSFDARRSIRMTGASGRLDRRPGCVPRPVVISPSS